MRSIFGLGSEKGSHKPDASLWRQDQRTSSLEQKTRKEIQSVCLLSLSPHGMYFLFAELIWSTKIMEPEGDNYTNRDWYFRYSHQRIIKGTEGLGNRRTSGGHPNYSIIENGQNSEKSPEDLRRPAVIQTQVKEHQLKLRWKTLKE